MKNLNEFKRDKSIVLTKDKLLKLKEIKNSIYHSIKIQMIFHSNKIEGSTFTEEGIQMLMQYRRVIGDHNLDDIIETVNSLTLFDYVITTLEEPLNKRLLLEWHSILKDNTKDDDYGFKGCFKKIPNMLTSTELKLCQPHEVPFEIQKLLEEYSDKKLSLDDVVRFHSRFERIHPFQDGNGRIGRFIILKQCIENNIPLVCIDNSNGRDYRLALNESQTKNDYTKLKDLFEESQDYFYKIFKDLEYSINNI